MASRLKFWKTSHPPLNKNVIFSASCSVFRSPEKKSSSSRNKHSSSGRDRDRDKDRNRHHHSDKRKREASSSSSKHHKSPKKSKRQGKTQKNNPEKSSENLPENRNFKVEAFLTPFCNFTVFFRNCKSDVPVVAECPKFVKSMYNAQFVS